MRIRYVSRWLAVLGFFAAAGAADAQTGAVSGRITSSDGGAPLQGANVEISTAAAAVSRVISGQDGSYTARSIPAGTYTVRVTLVGYGPRSQTVTVTAGGTATANFTLGQIASVLNPVTTTGTRGAGEEKILESPNSISLVSSERIAERPAATVTDHLKGQPGLSISNGGIVQANIVSRGFNNAFSTSMLMLQDYRFAGVPSLRVNVPFLFTGTGEDIERIEVLQGPASALYGPNSGAGVLHVITKSPFNSQGTSLTVDGGMRSMLRVAGRHAGTIGSQIGYKLSGEYFNADDFEYNDPAETGVGTTGAYSTTDPRVPASRRGDPVTRDFSLNRYSFEGRLDYRPNQDTEAITTFGYTMAGSALEITTTFGAAQVQNWSYTNFQQRFRHKQFFAQFFFNQSNAGNDAAGDDQGTYYLRSGIPVVDNSSVMVGQVQQGFQLGSARMTAGVDLIMTNPQTEGTIMGRNENDDEITEIGGYLQVTQPLSEKLDFLGAFRVDQNSRIEGQQFSPRAALLYKASPTQNFRLTFNRAFNSPASFSFFLDQWSGTNAALIPVQIMGNPPKEGWTFNRTCNAAFNGGLCMRSPFQSAGAPVASAASAGYPAFANSLTAIVTATPTSTTFTAAQKTALLNLLGGPVGTIVRSLAPTPAQAPSVMLDLNTRAAITNASLVRDLRPLGANFSNTWEIGYKGIIGNNLRISADYWLQIRPAEPTTQIVNPGVVFVPQALVPYLQANIAARLQSDYGMDAATANATAAAAAPAIGGFMAQIPQGAIDFTNTDLVNQPFFVFTYQRAAGQVDVRGYDLAVDYIFSDMYTLEATYSTINRNIWTDAPGASAANPLAANTPKQRGTITLRRTDTARRMTSELRYRYADPFDVNSGVYNNFSNAALYTRVPANQFLDFGFSWMVTPDKIRWAINVQNVLDNQVPSFIGVAPVGRFATTRISYTF